MVGEYDQGMYPGVYRVQLQDGSFVDAHRRQITRVRTRRVFCAVFDAPTMTPEGLSLPKGSLESARALGDKGFRVSEVVEFEEVRRHRVEDIPARPAFLATKGVVE